MSIKQADLVEAESLFATAIDSAENTKEHPRHLAAALNNLAFLFRVRHKYAEAEALYKRAIATWQSTLGPEDVQVAMGLSNLSVLCHLRGNVSEAEALARRAHAIYEKAYGKDHAEVARILNDVSEVLRGQSRYAEAESLCRISRASREEIFGTESPEHAQSLNNLAVLLELQAKFEEALPAYQQSLQVLDDTIEADHPDRGRVLLNFSAFCRRTGKLSEAERLLQMSFKIEDQYSESGVGLGGAMAFRQLAQALSVYRSLLAYAEPDIPWPVPCIRERPLIADQENPLDVYARSVRQMKVAMQNDPGNAAAVQREVESLGPWYHNVHLASDIFTNPARGDYPVSRWQFLAPHIPPDLSGKTALDIGCKSGYFSVELKKLGAARVVGIDIVPHILAQARFLSSWFDQPIELRELGAYELKRLGSFDIVFFIGVLYHLMHPMLALEHVAAACKDTLYVQTALRGGFEDFGPPDDYDTREIEIFKDAPFPKLHYIEKSYNGDTSNWWFANRSCFKAMLRTVGFKTIQDTDNPEILVCRKT